MANEVLDVQQGETMPVQHDHARIQLFNDPDMQRFRSNWSEIQASFVDELRHAVEQADHLVDDMVKRISEGFANERTKLEGDWSKGQDVSTEDLRQALRRYRSFFERLLAT